MKTILSAFLAVLSVSCATAPQSITPAQVESPWQTADRRDLRIHVERTVQREGQPLEAQDTVIYGDGAAIWNSRVQFHVSAADIDRILAAFDQADFEKIPERSPKGKRLLRRAAIRAGNYSKESSQTWEAPEDEQLKKLIDEVFSIVEPAVATGGMTAESLEDGLEKIASGRIAPQTLTLLMHLKPDASAPPMRAGFLFRIEDARATSIPYDGERIGQPSTVRLSESALREIASTLRSFEPEDFPVNLYARDYTEVTIAVMNRRKSVLARQFAGLTPTQHGDKQARFDQMVNWLEETRARLFGRAP